MVAIVEVIKRGSHAAVCGCSVGGSSAGGLAGSTGLRLESRLGPAGAELCVDLRQQSAEVEGRNRKGGAWEEPQQRQQQ